MLPKALPSVTLISPQPAPKLHRDRHWYASLDVFEEPGGGGIGVGAGGGGVGGVGVELADEKLTAMGEPATGRAGDAGSSSSYSRTETYPVRSSNASRSGSSDTPWRKPYVMVQAASPSVSQLIRETCARIDHLVSLAVSRDRDTYTSTSVPSTGARQPNASRDSRNSPGHVTSRSSSLSPMRHGSDDTSGVPASWHDVAFSCDTMHELFNWRLPGTRSSKGVGQSSQTRGKAGAGALHDAPWPSHLPHTSTYSSSPHASRRKTCA
mmetsp:Transcript_11336/g.36000  ORF Transcript_11336/g.36000 Transcript_11336/m.36000 type:complete len:266 (+) Transcript_11336:1474-2271(+)